MMRAGHAWWCHMRPQSSCGRVGERKVKLPNAIQDLLQAVVLQPSILIHYFQYADAQNCWPGKFAHRPLGDANSLSSCGQTSWNCGSDRFEDRHVSKNPSSTPKAQCSAKEPSKERSHTQHDANHQFHSFQSCKSARRKKERTKLDKMTKNKKEKKERNGKWKESKENKGEKRRNLNKISWRNFDRKEFRQRFSIISKKNEEKRRKTISTFFTKQTFCEFSFFTTKTSSSVFFTTKVSREDFDAQLRSTLAAHIVCCRGRPRTRRALKKRNVVMWKFVLCINSFFYIYFIFLFFCCMSFCFLFTKKTKHGEKAPKTRRFVVVSSFSSSFLRFPSRLHQQDVQAVDQTARNLHHVCCPNAEKNLCFECQYWTRNVSTIDLPMENGFCTSKAWSSLID